MNKFISDRIINNYIYNLQINNDINNKIKKLVSQGMMLKEIEEETVKLINNKNDDDNANANDNKKKKFDEQTLLQIKNIADELYQYHHQEVIKDNPEIQNYINPSSFIKKLIKKYLYVFSQVEINNNMYTAVGDEATNLSFSSQDVDYRKAPIVVCREFLENGEYKDHIFIGQDGQHHENIVSGKEDWLSNNCCDSSGKLIFACIYLYPNDIIYISHRDINTYPDVHELAHIIKNLYPQVKGIFYTDYPEKNQDLDHQTTTRLARKLL